MDSAVLAFMESGDVRTNKSVMGEFERAEFAFVAQGLGVHRLKIGERKKVVKTLLLELSRLTYLSVTIVKCVKREREAKVTKFGTLTYFGMRK